MRPHSGAAALHAIPIEIAKSAVEEDETMNTHWALDGDGKTLGELELPNDTPLADVAALGRGEIPGHDARGGPIRGRAPLGLEPRRARRAEGPMSPDDKDGLRAMMVEVMGAASESTEQRLGERLDGLQATLRDVQVDVALGLDKLDGIEIDVKDIKAHAARVSREHIKDRLRIADSPSAWPSSRRGSLGSRRRARHERGVVPGALQRLRERGPRWRALRALQGSAQRS